MQTGVLRCRYLLVWEFRILQLVLGQQRHTEQLHTFPNRFLKTCSKDARELSKQEWWAFLVQWTNTQGYETKWYIIVAVGLPQQLAYHQLQSCEEKGMAKYRARIVGGMVYGQENHYKYSVMATVGSYLHYQEGEISSNVQMEKGIKGVR